MSFERNVRPGSLRATCVLATASMIFAAATIVSAQTSAQHPKTQAAPATDGSVQASPTVKSASAPAVDASVQASPVNDAGGHGGGLPPRMALPIRLATGIDSGQLKNGQDVPATLLSPIRVGSRSFETGTPVELSVIATVPAGKLGAAGEFSLQLLRVGNVPVYTDTQTFHGKPGHKDLPDSAAQLGTDAGLTAGATLTFHVLPPPVAASGPPKAGVATPGSITGTASGEAPPKGASPNAGAATPSANGQASPTVNPGNTTSTPVHGSNTTQPR